MLSTVFVLFCWCSHSVSVKGASGVEVQKEERNFFLLGPIAEVKRRIFSYIRLLFGRTRTTAIKNRTMLEGVGFAVSVLQAQTQAQALASQSVDLFREEMDLQRRYHNSAMDQRTTFYMEQMTLTKLRHRDVLNLHKQTAAKEALYDNWQQHNEMYQTRIVTAALMFGCSLSSLADGNQQMPAEMSSYEALLIVFAALVSVGIALMFTCLLCLMVLYRRLSRFDSMHRLTRCPRCDRSHRDFDEFFRCTCKRLDQTSLAMFYAGSLVTFLGAVSLQIMKYVVTYKVWRTEASAAMLLGFAVPGVLVGTVGHCIWPDNTRSPACAVEMTCGSPVGVHAASSPF